MRILIVEDSEVNREYLLGVLAEYGEPVGVESAEEGLRLFRRGIDREEPFELVFMDILLPGMGGLQAIEEIRAEEQTRGIPEPDQAKIVVASALDDDASAKRAFFRGHVVSYLTKPLHFEEVKNELGKLGYSPTSASTTRTESPRAR